MTGKTSIEWVDQPGYVGAVWNPTTGCTRVSAGCNNCYAFALHDKRYASNLHAAEATDAGRSLIGRELIAEVRKTGYALPWPKQYDLPFSTVQLLPERLDAPLRTRKPTCYFVDSMADLFHEDVPDEFIDRVFSTMSSARRHKFLVLTKRPERMAAYTSRFMDSPAWDGFTTRDGTPSNEVRAPAPIFTPDRWPLPNVWLGTSVEDQRSADERIPHLLETPAAVRFLSCEPLLGPVDLTVHLERSRNNPLTRHLDWVIVGVESGSRARPFDLAWARSLRDQCASAGTAFFMKQCGSKPTDTTGCRVCADDAEDGDRELHAVHLREAHGRDPDEWPEDLRVREWPKVAVLTW
jgi:protein gp37